MLFTGESPSPFIGVLTADLTDSYQAEIWKGISCQAKEMGVGLLCLSGAPVHSPVNVENAANQIYTLTGRIKVDGYIVISSTIFNYLTSDEINDFINHQNLPLVSVGLEIPGYPSISVNGDPGMKSIIQHLVYKHNRKRFALISGPPEHEEVKSRKKVFFKTLKELNISFDEELFYTGNFSEESGAKAVEYLIGCRKNFDALVCLNDKMALSAIKTLQSYGWEIPEEISVVGFDNIDESEFCSPPLTTVQQPLFEMGTSAVKSLYQYINNNANQNIKLISSPVFRESCGCTPDLEFWIKQRDEAKKGHFTKNKTIIEGLLELIKQENSYSFLHRLNLMIQKTITEQKPLNDWYEILSVIQSYLTSYYKEKKSPLPEKQQIILESAFLLLEQNQSRDQENLRINEHKQTSNLRDIGTSLAGAFELKEVLVRLKQGLKTLGIIHAYLGIFPNDKIKEEIDIIPVLPRLSNKHPFAVYDNDEVPQWILNPLVFQEQLLGFLMLPGESMDPVVHNTLSRQLASSLKGTFLLEQVRKHERLLEEEVKNRTGELIKANERHMEEMERRIRLEEEVADISNRIMTRIGQDLHDDFCQYLAGISMMLSVQVENIKPDSPTRKPLEKITGLLNESIVRVKQIVRGLIPPGLKVEGLSLAIESLIEDVGQTSPGEIILYPDPENTRLEDEQELAVYRILQEAVNNAIRHSKSSKIEIRLSTESPGNSKILFTAEVRDWGQGLPASRPGKGIGLKIMEYRAEKAGGKLIIEKANPGTKVIVKLIKEI